MLRGLLLEYQVDALYDWHRLTPRKQNMVTLIATGHSNKQIAQDLSLSERTVKQHLTNSFRKLGLSSRLQLATFCVNASVGLERKPCPGRLGPELLIRPDDGRGSHSSLVVQFGS
jgi:DNA-binding CsgD family transcriptional regulator